MKTLNLINKQVSEVVFVSPGSRITSSGNGYIEWTPGTETDARNAPTWKTWAKGSAAGYMDTVHPMCIRATATGAMTVTVGEDEADKYGAGAYFEEDTPSFATDASGNVTGLVGPGGTRTRLADPQPMLDPSAPNGGRGTLVTNFQTTPVGTESTADVWPEKTITAKIIPQIAGDVGTYYADAATATETSDFQTIGFWAKANRRADGVPYSMCWINFGTTNTFANMAFCSVSIKADGKWRFYVVHKSQFGTAGAFTIGTTTFSHVRFGGRGSANALTLTAALVGGETSATLGAAFAGASGIYTVRFSSNEVRQCALTNGATAITWGPALTAAATTAIVYSTDRLTMQAADTIAFGPVYRNVSAKAFAYIRFDDQCADQYTPRLALATAYVGNSGVTIPAGVPQSGLTILEQFGLKASCFVLTSKFGQTPNYMTAAQLRDVQDRYGWTVGFQTNADPLNLGGAGLRLLGPYGYNYRLVYGSISAVDTSLDTITTAAAHSITTTSGVLGEQGFPVEFYGTDLPSPLVAGAKYWLKNTSTTAFKVYANELDSVAGTDAIDLTTTGTPASFNFRYWGSANDSSAILADFQTGQALLESNGLRGWKHYAMNQGAWDASTEEAILSLVASGNMQTVAPILGSTGVLTGNTFIPRYASAWVTGAFGSTASVSNNTTITNTYNLPVSIATEAASEATCRAAVRDACQKGYIVSFYHHAFSSEAQMRAFIAACDEIKLRVDQGLMDTGNVEELYARLSATGTEG